MKNQNKNRRHIAEEIISDRLNRPRNIQRGAILLALAGGFYLGVDREAATPAADLSLLGGTVATAGVGIVDRKRAIGYSDRVIQEYMKASGSAIVDPTSTTVVDIRQGKLTETSRYNWYADAGHMYAGNTKVAALTAPLSAWSGVHILSRVVGNPNLVNTVRVPGELLGAAFALIGLTLHYVGAEATTKDINQAYREQLDIIDGGLEFDLGN